MRLIIKLAFGLLLFLPTYQVVTQQWKEYASREGKFTILLPGEPTTGYRPINTDSPSSITYVINLQTPTTAYIIAYFDIPDPLTDSGKIKKLIDETRDRIIKLYSLKLQSESDLSQLNYSGRMLRMRTQDGKTFLTRILLVKQRIYHLSIVLLANQKESGDAEKYFESFKPIPLTDDEIKKLANTSKAESEKAVSPKIKVSEGVLRQNAIKKIQPSYPVGSKSAEVSGSVQVRVLISEEGQVIEAEVISGPEELRDAAKQAAKQWMFKPILIGNSPMKVDCILTFDFKLK